MQLICIVFQLSLNELQFYCQLQLSPVLKYICNAIPRDGKKYDALYSLDTYRIFHFYGVFIHFYEPNDAFTQAIAV